MKKFVFSLSVMISGIFVICSSLIAEGLVIGGYNAGGNAFPASLFSLNDGAVSAAFLIAGVLMFVVGLGLSIQSSKDK